MSNAEIADQLLSLAQLLSTRKENPFKVRAYRRAAKMIKTLPEGLEQLISTGADLTGYAGIGNAISAAIREIVLSGSLGQLQALRAQVSPEVAAISQYPLLDPARVLRIYKKLKISTVEELRKKFESGELAAALGPRMDQHVRQALTETHEMRLYDAEIVVTNVEEFLLNRCPVERVDVTGEYRRKVEVVREISFIVRPGISGLLYRPWENTGAGLNR